MAMRRTHAQQRSAAAVQLVIHSSMLKLTAAINLQVLHTAQDAASCYNTLV
jgi:hypothetical protein